VSAELVRLVRAEVARIEGEVAHLQAALTPLLALLESYNGKPVAARDRSHVRTTGRGGPSPQYNWDSARALWDQGKTTRQIADALKCPEATVKSASRRYNWPTSGRGQGSTRTGRRPRINWTEARRLWDDGLSAPDIAERLGVDQKTIYNGAEYRRWQPRTRDGKLVPKEVPARKSSAHPAPANHPWRRYGAVAAAGKHDWDLGLRLWNEQKSVPEIAKAVGVSEAAVYYRSKKWPKRPEQRTGRPPKDKAKVSTPTTSAVKRRMLAHPVACPNCGQQTWADPCHGCNTVLPTSLGGVGTSRRAGEED
jgi:transposase